MDMHKKVQLNLMFAATSPPHSHLPTVSYERFKVHAYPRL